MSVVTARFRLNFRPTSVGGAKGHLGAWKKQVDSQMYPHRKKKDARSIPKQIRLDPHHNSLHWNLECKTLSVASRSLREFLHPHSNRKRPRTGATPSITSSNGIAGDAL
eukprot:RCo042315